VNLPFTIGPQACHILRNEMRSKLADPPLMNRPIRWNHALSIREATRSDANPIVTL